MIHRYKIQQDKGQYCLKGCDNGDLTDYSALVWAVRHYGTHDEGCQWQVFPPGSRDCTCGLHAIIGVPNFASDAGVKR